MDTRKKHSNTTIHDNIRGIETCTIIYMVLFICNCEFDTDKLERALSSLIDIIFSGGFNFYHKYEVQWRPGIGPSHKANHPGIWTTFSKSRIFPHSHNVLSDSESGPTRDSGHGPPFFSPKS